MPILILILSFILSACGSDEKQAERRIERFDPTTDNSSGDPESPGFDSGSTRSQPGEGMSFSACLQKLEEEQTDFDGDGIKDIDEIKSWTTIIEGQSLNVFTDPLRADTDGDGRNDGDEEDVRMIDGSNANLPNAQSLDLHPARRNWIISVFSHGGSNSREAAANDVSTGWNTYDFLRAKIADRVRVKDLQLSQWSGGQGPQTAVGGGNNGALLQSYSDCDEFQCIANARLSSLLMKFQNSAERSSALGVGAVENMGARLSQDADLDGAPLEPLGLDGLYIAFRSNDTDGQNALGDNTGSLTLLVELENDVLDYPQAEILAGSAEANAIIASLCP